MSVEIEVEERDLRHLMENIWGEMLFADVQPFIAVGSGLTLTWRGYVRISGDWDGYLGLECSDGAVSFVRDVLGSGDGAGPGEREDAFLELVNITGGSIKSFAPGICELSLPTLGDPPAAGPAIVDAVYRCAGHPVRIRIFAVRA